MTYAVSAKTVALATELLQPGERLERVTQPSLGWSWALLVASLGLWPLWRVRNFIAVTDQRLIRRKGLITRSEQSIPIEKVLTVNLDETLVSGSRLNVLSAGEPASTGIEAGSRSSGIGVENLSRAEGRELRNAILAHAETRRRARQRGQHDY
jgi:membrane protein YdbS with pleckstrin-like domain